ncbi:hypothetical protein BC936DRAFT_146051, partial [Jimgerdemannia flammicorona]
MILTTGDVGEIMFFSWWRPYRLPTPPRRGKKWLIATNCHSTLRLYTPRNGLQLCQPSEQPGVDIHHELEGIISRIHTSLENTASSSPEEEDGEVLLEPDDKILPDAHAEPHVEPGVELGNDDAGIEAANIDLEPVVELENDDAGIEAANGEDELDSDEEGVSLERIVEMPPDTHLEPVVELGNDYAGIEAANIGKGEVVEIIETVTNDDRSEHKEEEGSDVTGEPVNRQSSEEDNNMEEVDGRQKEEVERGESEKEDEEMGNKNADHKGEDGVQPEKQDEDPELGSGHEDDLMDQNAVAPQKQHRENEDETEEEHSSSDMLDQHELEGCKDDLMDQSDAVGDQEPDRQREGNETEEEFSSDELLDQEDEKVVDVGGRVKRTRGCPDLV